MDAENRGIIPLDSLLASEYEEAKKYRAVKSDLASKTPGQRESTNASEIEAPNLNSPTISRGINGLFSQDSKSKEFSVMLTPKAGTKQKDMSPRLNELRRIKHSQMPNSFRQGRNNPISEPGQIFTPSQAMSQWTWGGKVSNEPASIGLSSTDDTVRA